MTQKTVYRSCKNPTCLNFHLKTNLTKGPSMNDFRKILGYVDPLLPLVTDSCPIMQIIRLSSYFVLPPYQCVHHLCLVLKLRRPMHSLSVMREHFLLDPVQASAKRLWPGLVDFVPAIAYHFCVALPAAFTQTGYHLLAEPCTI